MTTDRTSLATAELLHEAALELLNVAESKFLAGDPEESAIADVKRAEELLNARDEILEERYE